MNTTVEIDRARARARRLYRSERFVDAYVKGVRAALASRPIDACPYSFERATGRQTWRSAYRHAWILGWQSIAEAGMDDK